jgi:hypothetical protein
MAEKQTNAIVVDDKEYAEETLTQEQKLLAAHIRDLERKIQSTQFNLDQLAVGKKSFVQMLVASLQKEEEPEAVN